MLHHAVVFQCNYCNFIFLRTHFFLVHPVDRKIKNKWKHFFQEHSNFVYTDKSYIWDNQALNSSIELYGGYGPWQQSEIYRVLQNLKCNLGSTPHRYWWCTINTNFKNLGSTPHTQSQSENFLTTTCVQGRECFGGLKNVC